MGRPAWCQATGKAGASHQAVPGVTGADSPTAICGALRTLAEIGPLGGAALPAARTNAAFEIGAAFGLAPATAAVEVRIAAWLTGMA